MRVAVAVLIVLLAAGCSSLSEEARGWCEDSQVGSMLLAAEELGRFEEMVAASTALATAFERGIEDSAALDQYYSDPHVIAACNLAYERAMSGRPLVEPG